MTLLLFRQVSTVNDSVASADDASDSVASQHGMATLNDVVETNVNESRNEVNDPNAVVDEVDIETDDDVHRQTVEESALDEGWQEAYSKGRSGNGAGKKFRQRQPYQRVLPLNRNLNGRQDVHQQYISSPLQKTAPRPSLSKSSSLRALKNTEIDVSTNAVKPQVKSPGSAAVTSTSTLVSKSLSYKEVALAPPGTVLKPMLEKLELNLERTETQIYRISSSSSTGEESKSDAVMLDLPVEEGTEVPCEKQESEESVVESVENLTSESEGDLGGSCSEQKASDIISRRKLSAAAEPYNPGGFLVTDPHILVAESISGTGLHSPQYYGGATYSNGIGMPKTMNPDAPEFVPRRSVLNSSQHASVSVDSSSSQEVEKNAAVLKKEELARQILLSFMVNSSHKEVVAARKKVSKPKDELEDTSVKDSTVTEIVYGREEDSAAKESETDGGEGFVIVAKRRRKKRLTNDAAGMYHQPSSVCA